MREYEQKDVFYNNDENNKIWWIENADLVGVWEFSFDKQTIFNMFAEYPWCLTQEQKNLFDQENPFWADFFRDRTINN